MNRTIADRLKVLKRISIKTAFIFFLLTINHSCFAAPVFHETKEDAKPKLTCEFDQDKSKESAVISSANKIPIKITLTFPEGMVFGDLKGRTLTENIYFRRKMLSEVSEDILPPEENSDYSLTVNVTSMETKKKVKSILIERSRKNDLTSKNINLQLILPVELELKKEKMRLFFKKPDEKLKKKFSGLPRRTQVTMFKNHRRLLEASFYENRSGEYRIDCQYLGLKSNQWKGKLKSPPIFLKVENNGGYYEQYLKRLEAGNKTETKPLENKPPKQLGNKKPLKASKELEDLFLKDVRQMRGEGLSKIKKGLKSADPEDRKLAIKILSELAIYNYSRNKYGLKKKVILESDPELLSMILASLNDHVEKVRMSSVLIFAFGYPKSSKIEAAILSQMEKEESFKVINNALLYFKLSDYLGERSQQFLRKLFHSDDRMLRGEASHIIGAHKLDWGLPLLIKRLKNKEGDFNSTIGSLRHYHDVAFPMLPELEGILEEKKKQLAKATDSEKHDVEMKISRLEGFIKKIRLNGK